MMSFDEWMLTEAKKKHKKKHGKKHPYYCPGCGLPVFVHPTYGPLVYDVHNHTPHHCPTTNSGVPGGLTTNAPSGTVAATVGAAQAATSAVSAESGTSSGGDGGAGASGGSAGGGGGGGGGGG